MCTRRTNRLYSRYRKTNSTFLSSIVYAGRQQRRWDFLTKRRLFSVFSDRLSIRIATAAAIPTFPSPILSPLSPLPARLTLLARRVGMAADSIWVRYCTYCSRPMYMATMMACVQCTVYTVYTCVYDCIHSVARSTLNKTSPHCTFVHYEYWWFATFAARNHSQSRNLEEEWKVEGRGEGGDGLSIWLFVSTVFLTNLQDLCFWWIIRLYMTRRNYADIVKLFIVKICYRWMK